MLEVQLGEIKDEDNLLNESNKSNKIFTKKFKIFLIIGIISIITIIIVLLCVYLPKDSDDSTPNTTPNENNPEDIKNFIKLEVYSESDDKEIFFLSEEYKPKENDKYTIYIDGSHSSYKKSVKLNKGMHNITIVFNETINSCQNMFKNCKDITNI